MKRPKRKNKIEKKWDEIAKSKGFKNRRHLLKSLFKKHNKNISKVAEELKITITSVHNHFKRFNIKIPKNNKGKVKIYEWEKISLKYNFSSVKNFIMYLKKHYNVVEACELIGCSRTTLYRALKKYEVKKNKKNLFAKKSKVKASKRKRCGCCKTAYIKKGFRFLCEQCWKNNDYSEEGSIF